MFVAATVPVETHGETSPLVEEAQRIGVAPDESTADSPAGRQPDWQPGDPAQVRELNPGTFEAFMGSFGSPRKWAGR